jgi:hypothetical protein
VAAGTGHALRLGAASGRSLQGLAGLGLVAYGCWLAYPPAGSMVAGLGLLVDRWDEARKGGDR